MFRLSINVVKNGEIVKLSINQLVRRGTPDTIQKPVGDRRAVGTGNTNNGSVFWWVNA
jgi:hypothetical protein